MKKTSLNIVMVIMLVAGLSYGQLVASETGLIKYNNMTTNITALDRLKKVIKLDGKEFSYDSNTVITNYKGEKVSEDQLQMDIFVTITLDTAQRYIGRPVIKVIHIETGEGE